MARFGWSEEKVLFEVESCKGWTFVAWATENEPWMNVEMESDGYIAQEIERRLKG